MNRENKKKSFEKITIKHTHVMKRSSVRSAGKQWCRQAQGAITGTIARIVCPASIWITNRETGQQNTAA